MGNLASASATLVRNEVEKKTCYVADTQNYGVLPRIHSNNQVNAPILEIGSTLARTLITEQSDHNRGC